MMISETLENPEDPENLIEEFVWVQIADLGDDRKTLKLRKELVEQFDELCHPKSSSGKRPKIPLMSHIISQLWGDGEEGYGSTEAVLELFIFTDCNEMGRYLSLEDVRKAIAKKKWESHTAVKVSYDGSSGTWDFHSKVLKFKTREIYDDYWNYQDHLFSLDQNGSAVLWKVTDGEHGTPKFLKQARKDYGDEAQLWVRNYSIEELERWILPTQIPSDITSVEIADMAAHLGIDWRQATRKEVWTATRKEMLSRLDLDKDFIKKLKKAAELDL